MSERLDVTYGVDQVTQVVYGQRMTKNMARIEIRVSQEDKERILKRAASQGYPDRAFSAWARSVLLDELVPVDRPSTKVLSVPETAKRLGVERQQVYALISAGRLPAHQLPEGLRVELADIRAYQKQRRK